MQMAGLGVSCSEPSFSVVATLDTKEEENICICSSRNGNLLTGHESKFKVWSCTVADKYEWTLIYDVSIPEKGDVTCISQFPDTNEKYAVSFNNCVAVYTLLSGSCLQPLHMFHFNADEINQIDINSKGTLICAGDDNGEIKVIDIENLCLYKTLTRQHNNICSTVRFNPRKPWEIFSGGLDCQLIRWDFSRGRPLFVLDIQESDRKGGMNDYNEQTTGSYMVNPPMAHSIDVFGSIHSFACGLGDGSVSVYSALSSKRLEAICSTSLHSASVAYVRCLETPSEQEARALNHFVVSGGNDGKICISRLRYEQRETQTKAQKKQRNRLQQASGDLDLTLTISHGSKVNWIAVCNKSKMGETLKPSATVTYTSSPTLMMFVADQTSLVTMYEVSTLSFSML